MKISFSTLLSMLYSLILLPCIFHSGAEDNPAPRVTSGISANDSIITDSKMSLAEALNGKNIPPAIKESLCLIDVEYYSFDYRLHKGQLIVNKNLANDLKEIFEVIKQDKFPIAKVIPIARYNWSDSLSMLENNTSCFNYRTVNGTKVLSSHALGKAIDINPYLNPQVKNGKYFPREATYNIQRSGTITETSIIVRIFKKKGWKWGGNWRSTKDYQHFEKK